MPLTAQSIFDTIMVLDNERDLSVGGDEVEKGLTCLNTVLKWLEAEAAAIEGVLTTHDLLYTAENVETTDWPYTLLRLDALWYVDSSTNRPVYELDEIQGIGHHVPGFQWPLSELVMTGSSTTVTGPPKEYAASGPGGQFYWAPMPNDEYWIRGYGLWMQADDYFADADDVFPYPPTLRLPFSAVCDQLMKTGLDRDLTAVQGLATKSFHTALKGLKKFNRSNPTSRTYSEVHSA